MAVALKASTAGQLRLSSLGNSRLVATSSSSDSSAVAARCSESLISAPASTSGRHNLVSDSFKALPCLSIDRSSFSKYSNRTSVRCLAQGQKEKANDKGQTVRELLEDFRSKGGLEAAKKGAEIAKQESQKDLNWYRSLKKPWFAPPEPVYGLAWTVLYGMMGAATWMVINEGGIQKQALPLAAFAAQLYFNFRWPVLFFVEKNIGKAQIDNLFLLASLLLTYQLYRNVSPTAGQLILPAVIWVIFANVLNYVILFKNQED